MSNTDDLSHEESQQLFKIATSLGHNAYWQISANQMYCLICGEHLGEYRIGAQSYYVVFLVPHMKKHLKLKAFL